MNEKPTQPDPLAARSPLHLHGPGYTMLTGPLKFDAGLVGLYLGAEDCERLLALIQFAAQRLDSGKVSRELKASERIIRRLLPLLDRDVVGANRQFQEEQERQYARKSLAPDAKEPEEPT